MTIEEDKEASITTHAEGTRKSIKKLKLASVAVWFLSMGMAGFGYLIAGEPDGFIFQSSLAVWLVSIGMVITAMFQEWWHHA